MTSLPWMSSQARTQRSQRMQASWLTAMTGLEWSSPRPEPRASSAVLLLDAVPAHEHEQLVVGGRRLLGVLLDRRLVDQQQLGELRAVALELGRRGLDLHPVLARAHAGRRVDARADVDDAHAAHADRVVALVVAEDRDLDAGVLGGLPRSSCPRAR